MPYDKSDELAINTIRLLAVSFASAPPFVLLPRSGEAAQCYNIISRHKY